MRKPIHLLLLLTLLALVGCSKKETTITSLDELAGGKTFAVPTGTVADQFVLKRFPDAKIGYYPSVLDCALAVKTGKADAGVYDLPILKNIVARNEGLAVLPELIVDDRYGFGFRQSDTELKQEVDGVLADLKSSGTYNDMMKRWFPDKGSPAPMPDIPLTGANGVLRFGTAAVTEPMSFVDANHNIVGFDIEFAARVAQKLGKKLEIVNMDFGAMLPALIAGKVDMIGAGLSITEERAKRILYSESYYPSGIAVMVRSAGKPEPGRTTAKMRGASDVRDKAIGVLLGSVYDAYTARTYPQAKVREYQDASDLLVALDSGKVDAAFYDQGALPPILKANPGLGILAKNVISAQVGAGFNRDNGALREQFNAFLKEIRSNGTYDDMVKRWVEQGDTEMPRIETPNKNGVLHAGVVNDLGMPFSLIKDGQLIGFDIEIATRFAAYTGREFQPVPLEFGSLIASIATHKIDIITASMFITEERKKMIDFSDPYYEAGGSLIARNDRIERAPAALLSSVDDLAGKKIGVFTGTVFDGYIQQKYPTAQILRYESPSDMVLSIQTGKVDAALFDLITARLLIKHNPDLGLLSEIVLSTPLGVGFSKSDPGLRNDFNDFLREIRADGTYAAMNARWLTGDAETAAMPKIPPILAGRKLVAGVSINDLPYVAYKDGSYEGFDIELLQSFAQRKGYNLEIVTMEFSALINSLAAGKVQMIADGISITEERKKQVDFSDPYANFQAAVVAAKKNLGQYAGAETAPVSKSFFERVGESFYSNIILEHRYRLILDGLKVTILISIFAALVGTVLGGVICWMRMSKNVFLSRAAALYISLLRGTPVLVLLMIVYYIVFASVNINPVIVAVLAFGMNFAAYVSEMFRTSIESIDKGQKEAGIAGGFTEVETFVYIIFPQALRHLLPVYKGEFISLVKMTSIVGYIAVQDLTKASDIIRSRTFDAFFPLIMAAVIYLVLAWLLSWALGAVEISVDPKRRTVKPLPEAKQ